MDSQRFRLAAEPAMLPASDAMVDRGGVLTQEEILRRHERHGRWQVGLVGSMAPPRAPHELKGWGR